MDTVPKSRQTAWTIGLTSVVVVAAVIALVTINDKGSEERTDPPPPPQVFHDVITVASLLDAVPIAADPTSAGGRRVNAGAMSSPPHWPQRWMM